MGNKMKKIEEILKAFKPSLGYDKDIAEAMQDYAEQQVSIAVEKALSACDKHISIYSQIDYNFTSLAPQILEELKGGEGE